MQFVDDKYAKSRLIKLVTQNIVKEILKYNDLETCEYCSS